MVKRAAKKVVPKKSAPVEEPVIDETVVSEEAVEEVVEAVEEASAEEMETESQDNEEEATEENEEETETVEAEAEVEAEADADAEVEAEAENEEENEDEEKTPREPKVNTYVTTHPDEFASQIMKDIKNDFNTANRRGGPRNNGKKDMLRIRQKRAQLSLDTIIVYGDREYRNCSSVPLMSLSFTLRETIQKYRKSISAGKRDEVCPDKLHHTIIKVDNELGLNGLRAVLKWMHTGDLNLTAENFEEIVAVVLYFRIKMLRQSLVKLGRKVGIKFVPVPANEKTIARREKEGKPTLPNGFEECEKLEDGEEALPEDAKVVEGKDVLAKIKSAAKITHLKEIPGQGQKKEGENTRNNNRNNRDNQKNKKEGEVKKEGESKADDKENKNKRQQNRKRSNTGNKVDESGEAKKSKMADGIKKENDAGNKMMREIKRNNTSGGARGARAQGNRGTFTSTRGGARGGGSQSAGKSIYREHSQQAQSQLQQSYAPPQANYYQPTYQAPQAYGYAPPPQQYQQPMPQGYQQPQQPYNNQYRQPQQGNNQGYYGGR